MIVVGIDSGTQRLGVGALDCERGRAPRFVAAEVISATGSRIERLVTIARELRECFAELAPHALGIEEAFVGKFAGAGLAVSEARGVVIACAPVPASRITSYPSAVWKHALGLKGNADKFLVGQRVRFLLQLSKVPAEDAADALGVAWATALSMRMC